MPGVSIKYCIRLNKSNAFTAYVWSPDAMAYSDTVGILVAVLNQLLVRSGREEQAMMTTLAGLVVVMMILVREISGLFQLIKTLFDL